MSITGKNKLVRVVMNRWRFLLAASLLITHYSLLIPVSAQTMYGDVSYTKQAFFRIPFTTEPNQRLKLVQLYYSLDQGQTWHPYDSVTPQQLHPGNAGRSHLLEGHFDFQANKDGVYWFTTRIVDLEGRGNPLTMENVRPGLKVCVDTQPPVINLRALTPREGEVGVSWDVRDDNLDPSTLSLEYRLPGSAEWRIVSGDGATGLTSVLPATGQRYWRPYDQGIIEVRLRARDRASNWGEEKTQVSLNPGIRDQGLGANRGAPTTDGGSNPQTVIPSETSRHLVNSKRISLNYVLKEVGPSSVSLVELWVTRDGRNWQKYTEDTSLSTSSPGAEGREEGMRVFPVEVNEEGLYGFTLVARSGVGLGERPPQVGDPPQVWVEVDLTKPVVKILNIEPPRSLDDRNLTITWSASDRNFGPRPITLFYRSAGPARGSSGAGENPEETDATWHPIGDKIDNTGRYVWAMPSGVPFRMYFKVEAIDRAGNANDDKTSNPILVDLSKPKVSITNVESRNP